VSRVLCLVRKCPQRETAGADQGRAPIASRGFRDVSRRCITLRQSRRPRVPGEGPYEPSFAYKPFKQALRQVFTIAKAADFAEDVLFPKPKYWRAFCEDFERKLLVIHAISKQKLIVKPDDDEGDMLKTGPWHRWSIAHLHRAIEELARRGKPTPVLAYLTVNILDDVPTKMPPGARKAWLVWLDKLRTFGRPKELTEDDVWEDFAIALFETVPKREREEILESLSRSMRHLLENATD